MKKAHVFLITFLGILLIGSADLFSTDSVKKIHISVPKIVQLKPYSIITKQEFHAGSFFPVESTNTHQSLEKNVYNWVERRSYTNNHYWQGISKDPELEQTMINCFGWSK